MAFFVKNECVNLLRCCWQTRHLREGLRILTRPARVGLYRARKRISKRTTLQAETHARLSVPPVFGGHRRPEFASRMEVFEVTAGLDSLFADVDKQLHGVFRLAGARYRRIGNMTGEEWDDPEDRYAYHRLYWAARYARASAFGHPRAVEGFERDWLTWRDQRSTQDPLARAAYTVSERIASLVESLYWLPDAAAERLAIPLKEQIWMDTCLLTVTVEHALGVHNHLLNNARALFLASAALAECEDAASWRRQAFEIWDTYFPQLVLEDGTFAEQSSHYHLLLCRTALEYVLASRLCAHALPEGFETKVRHMFRLANDLLRSDGTLPRFGDSSPDHTIEDLWGLSAAAYHCGLLKESPRHSVVTPLTLYYSRPGPQIPSPSPGTNQVYPAGGFAFLRSAVSEAELVVHADPRPEGRAHGDGGRGSFELWWRGAAVIREPGSFLQRSNAKSSWYRSAAAQNVTCLNGLAPGVTQQEWDGFPRWYWPADRSDTTMFQNRLRFRCHSFQRLRPGLVLERVWWFDQDGSLVLEERIDGDRDGQRFMARFESRLCLGEREWDAVLWNGREVALHSKGPAQDSEVRITIDVPHGIRVSLREGGSVPEYGIERAAKVLELSGRVQLPCQWRMRCEFFANSSPCVTTVRSSGHVPYYAQPV